MALIEWQIRGTEMTNCNCNWGCPCQFNSLPTGGSCRALSFVQIDRGHFGKVTLDGLRWGMFASWPGPIHLGNGTFQSVVDVRAGAEQRAALEAISQGRETEPGTLIWQVFSTTVTKLLPTLVEPIDLAIDLKNRAAHVKIPGIVDAQLNPIKNPVTGAAHRAVINLPNGFEFTNAEIVSGKAKAHGEIALDFDGTHAHLAQIAWSTHGVLR
jgi:hypothetical protein